MADMRRLMKIVEAAYVPGTQTDPSTEWRSVDGRQVRKPGRQSVMWEVAPGQQDDWMIVRVSDGSAQGRYPMTQKDWRHATGTVSPQFAIVGRDGVLSFDDREDAEKAIVAYEEGNTARGYSTPHLG